VPEPDEQLRAYLVGLSREQLAGRLLALARRDELAETALRAEVRLADARRAGHPGDAVAVYRRLLDGVLEHTDVRAYREGVSLLRELRSALAACGREEEFAADVGRIREEHRRRPRLMSLLDAEGW
jgi:uncharacterized Zn finger protein